MCCGRIKGFLIVEQWPKKGSLFSLLSRLRLNFVIEKAQKVTCAIAFFEFARLAKQLPTKRDEKTFLEMSWLTHFFFGGNLDANLRLQEMLHLVFVSKSQINDDDSSNKQNSSVDKKSDNILLFEIAKMWSEKERIRNTCHVNFESRLDQGIMITRP